MYTCLHAYSFNTAYFIYNSPVSIHFYVHALVSVFLNIGHNSYLKSYQSYLCALVSSFFYFSINFKYENNQKIFILKNTFMWTNDFPTPDSFCLVLSWADFHWFILFICLVKNIINIQCIEPASPYCIEGGGGNCVLTYPNKLLV